MKQVAPLLFTLFFVLPFSARAASTIETTGDIVQVLVPLAGYGATFYLEDEEGRDQFYKSFASTFLITHSVKIAVNKERPNGGDHSFPSGHTSAAFQGAAFIHARYGLTYGIPAYAAAAFVGHSRIVSNNHWVSDVLAGAALGTACSLYFTTRHPDFAVQPIVSEGNFGLQISGNW